MIQSPAYTETLAPVLAQPAGLTPQWYALYTRSNYEKYVSIELANKGVEVYLPTVREVHRWKDRKKTLEVPVFRSYVFTRFADAASERLRVLQTSGVVRILGNGNAGSIEPVPTTDIESVRKLVDSAMPFTAHPFLREGARVRVKRGPLKGIEGLLVRFKGQTRLVLTVEMLEKAVAAEVDPTDVEVCH